MGVRKDPLTSVQIPTELKKAAQAAAAAEGRTLTDVINDGLRRYVKRRERAGRVTTPLP